MQLLPKMYDHFTIANNIEKLDGPVFVRDDKYNEYIAAKKEISHQAYHSCSAIPYQINLIADYIGRQTGLYESSLNEIAENIQEDIAIFRVNNGADWLSYCHISFPAGWRPEDAIGKSFEEIHKPVPGFVFNPKLLHALLHGKYQRFLWGTIYENKLNNYPGNLRPFTLDKPQFWLKIEKQITIGFPAVGCFLFVMREYIYNVNQIDLKVLDNTIKSMSQINKDYKGITKEFEGYINELVRQS